MTIPVQWYDEDFYICRTIEDAIEKLSPKPQEKTPGCKYPYCNCGKTCPGLFPGEQESLDEQAIEQVWKDTKGIIPSSGQMWLTPRMLREAAKVQEIWKEQESQQGESWSQEDERDFEDIFGAFDDSRGYIPLEEARDNGTGQQGECTYGSGSHDCSYGASCYYPKCNGTGLEGDCDFCKGSYVLADNSHWRKVPCPNCGSRHGDEDSYEDNNTGRED